MCVCVCVCMQVCAHQDALRGGVKWLGWVHSDDVVWSDVEVVFPGGGAKQGHLDVSRQ